MCRLGLWDIIKMGFKRNWVEMLFYLCMISGFRRDLDEMCALLGCYAA